MLTRWDPLREMLSLRSQFDKMFDNALVDSESWETASTWSLAIDVAETDDAYVVKASVPGIEPENLEITYSSNVLTIKGETKVEKEVNEAKYHMRERRYGSFSRSISIPSTVDVETIKADYDQGILTLTLPKADEAKPKRIVVKPKGVIEAELKDKG